MASIARQGFRIEERWRWLERRKKTQTSWKKDLFSNAISGLQPFFLYNINQQEVLWAVAV